MLVFRPPTLNFFGQQVQISGHCPRQLWTSGSSKYYQTKQYRPHVLVAQTMCQRTERMIQHDSSDTKHTIHTVWFSDTNDKLWVESFAITFCMHQLHGTVLQSVLDIVKDALIPTIEHQLKQPATNNQNIKYSVYYLVYYLSNTHFAITPSVLSHCWLVEKDISPGFILACVVRVKNERYR